MCIAVLPALGVILAFVPLRADAAAAPGEIACRERLEDTLSLMEDRPLMKEEVATGLMWMRLDAEGALDAGDPSTCHEIMSDVEAILSPGSRDR